MTIAIVNNAAWCRFTDGICIVVHRLHHPALLTEDLQGKKAVEDQTHHPENHSIDKKHSPERHFIFVYGLRTHSTSGAGYTHRARSRMTANTGIARSIFNKTPGSITRPSTSLMGKSTPEKRNTPTDKKLTSIVPINVILNMASSGACQIRR